MATTSTSDIATWTTRRAREGGLAAGGCWSAITATLSARS
jgi:hypothetical protein